MSPSTLLTIVLAGQAVACGATISDPTCSDEPSQTATCVVDFSPGDGAGFGQDEMPDVVFGPPSSAGSSQGSLDVVSLGYGGSITLSFGEAFENLAGPEFVVFENAFVIGTSSAVFSEPAEVAISTDGETFVVFPCDRATGIGCAGTRPTLRTGDGALSAPLLAGGNPFDLEDINAASASFVRITDVSLRGSAPTAGFDLDAIILVQPRPAP